jgi:hypothetical protein
MKALIILIIFPSLLGIFIGSVYYDKEIKELQTHVDILAKAYRNIQYQLDIVSESTSPTYAKERK